MNKLSRWMPSRPVHKTPLWGFPIIALFLLGVGYWIYRVPELLWLILFLAFLIWRSSEKCRYSMQSWAKTRSGENICSFVRAFDFRHTDTWVLRAVYEELSVFLGGDNHPFPIRADDRWQDDLEIDSEDMEWDVLPDIAYRACRSLENTEQNPFYDKVKTVRDLVHFLEYQPKLQRDNQIA